LSACFASTPGRQRALHSFPTRRSSDLDVKKEASSRVGSVVNDEECVVFGESLHGNLILLAETYRALVVGRKCRGKGHGALDRGRSEEHTSELQSRENLVCRLLLEKKNK